MPTYDFECSNCDHEVLNEVCTIAEAEEGLCCPACGGELERLIGAPNIFTTIVPTYPGSAKRKAGHVHKHANRPATKTQVGFGGGVSPEHPKK
ncbi:MAG: FmdB family zinc ribbon protein [Planctomycetota bacterium]